MYPGSRMIKPAPATLNNYKAIFEMLLDQDADWWCWDIKL